MDKSDLVTLVVAALSLLAAISSQRQSAKASKGNNETAIITSRTDLETEAYIRARAIDTETIQRQAAELKEVRAEMHELEQKYDELDDKYDDLVDQNKSLRDRIIELERHLDDPLK